MQGVVDFVRVNLTCLVDIDGDLSNGVVGVCENIFGSALRDDVPAPNPISAIEHEAAHLQEYSFPPLRRFEAREDRRYGSNVIKYPLLVSCRTGMHIPGILPLYV